MRNCSGVYPRLRVDAGGSGIVSQAGGVQLVETARRAAGLDRALSVALAEWRKPLAVLDPGKVVLDLAVTLALGGDCLADVAVLRAEPGVYGRGPLEQPGVPGGTLAEQRPDEPGGAADVRGGAAGVQPGSEQDVGHDATCGRHRLQTFRPGRRSRSGLPQSPQSAGPSSGASEASVVSMHSACRSVPVTLCLTRTTSRGRPSSPPFVGADGAEPRCIEYRVRVVPTAEAAGMSPLIAGHRVLQALEEDAARPRSDGYLAAARSAPAEGIPRYVFERASQSRLLAKARRDVARRPDRYRQDTAGLLARQERRRVGRPPVRSLGEKLAVLQSVEDAYATGGTLDDVAQEHAMSRSAVRDLVSWARRDAQPRLFTGYGPGRRGGELTPEARRLLAEEGRG